MNKLQEKLGELIYDLGERDFDAIKNNFWNKHINKGEKFTDKQIETFELFIEELIEDDDFIKPYLREKRLNKILKK